MTLFGLALLLGAVFVVLFVHYVVPYIPLPLRQQLQLQYIDSSAVAGLTVVMLYVIN